MIAYNLDPLTNEYTGREPAQEDPKRPGEYLIPAHATLTEPPAIREGYARIWNGEAWDYIEDHRGETVWRDHDTQKVVDTLGPIPEGWSTTRPEKQLTRSDITEMVYAAKAGKAYGGLTVNRSGLDYLFATDPESIALCNAVLISGAETISWKVWANGEPATLELTSSDFRAIFGAGMAMIQSAFDAESELNAEYAAMTDAQIAALKPDEVSAHIAERFALIHPAVEV